MPETLVSYKCTKCRNVYESIDKCVACEASHESLLNTPIVGEHFSSSTNNKYPRLICIKVEGKFLVYAFNQTIQSEQLPKDYLV